MSQERAFITRGENYMLGCIRNAVRKVRSVMMLSTQKWWGCCWNTGISFRALSSKKTLTNWRGHNTQLPRWGPGVQTLQQRLRGPVLLWQLQQLRRHQPESYSCLKVTYEDRDKFSIVADNHQRHRQVSELHRFKPDAGKGIHQVSNAVLYGHSGFRASIL